MIIHLNGWPGVGKLTIGRVLAAQLKARLIDNHLLHDVAIACTGFEAPERWPLYEAVRAAAYETLAQRPKSETFVMTNALCTGSERERQAWDHVVDLAMRRDVPLIPVVLEAAVEENIRRVQSRERVGRKLADPAVLRSYLGTDTIQRPAIPTLLVLDVTEMTAEQAASAIAKHVRHANAWPASDRHRVFASP